MQRCGVPTAILRVVWLICLARNYQGMEAGAHRAVLIKQVCASPQFA